MFTPIRAASLDDPRPQLGDGAVLTAAVKLVLPSFVEWTKARGLDLTDEQITFAVELALKQSKTAGVDWAWTSAKVLETAFGLPGDGKLIARLEAVIANQKLAWERETRAWVLRTGYRIPADEQEKVEALVEGVPVVWQDRRRLARPGRGLSPDRGRDPDLPHRRRGHHRQPHPGPLCPRDPDPGLAL
ncbi:hypothetical protein CcrBL47_gp499 [Caulobacter phage BL47]|nr:hypothetical protein CcrBL47_gp499 [Caulobacter phage BL47]